MKAEWTSTEPALAQVTLGDDAARHTLTLDGLGAEAQEQVEMLFRAGVAQRWARGNVAGDLVLTASRSHASVAAAAAYYQGEEGRVGQTGTLVLTFAAGAAWTLTGAVLRGVRCVEVTGVRWGVRYTFGRGVIA